MEMTEVKTTELAGDGLDWAVAKAVGEQLVKYGGCFCLATEFDGCGEPSGYSPSTDWSQGGPLIEKYTIGVDLERDGLWVATPPNWNEETIQYGSTPLIAACRAIVAAKLGGVVSVPSELVECPA